MQKALIVFCLLAISALSMPVNLDELKSLWSSWKIYYGKSYGLAEEAARFAIFVENYKYIVTFNGENETPKLALNKFSDITAEEFSQLHAGCYNNGGKNIVVRAENEYQVYDAPDSVDWRTKGAVTPIKDQGQCGSCWSFSTTGALEGLYFLNKNKLVSFSEQQIIDCDTNDNGCDGGLPYQAMEYTADSGLETEDEYPYTAADGDCAAKKLKTVKTNSDYKLIVTQSVDALKAAVAIQPVSVGIEADQKVFQSYSSGIISKNCGNNLDHAVLVVGYTADYFIVKNSWGTQWGQQGYVFISTNGDANNGDGVCGILGQPSVPTW